MMFLHDNVVQPILTYGSAIWDNTEYINAIKNKAYRFLEGVGRTTPNLAVRGDMSWRFNITKLKIEVVRFLKKLNTAPRYILTACVTNWPLSFRKSRGGGVVWLPGSLELPVLGVKILSNIDFQIIKLKLTDIDRENLSRGLLNYTGNSNSNK